MGGIAGSLTQSWKALMIVLGFIGAYPQVNVTDTHFQKDGQTVIAAARLENLVNPAIEDVVSNGIPVNIVFHVQTYSADQPVYQAFEVRRLSFTKPDFFINQSGYPAFTDLRNALSEVRLTLCTNSSAYAGRKLVSDISLSLNSDKAEDIIYLWGNRPRIHLEFSIIQ